MMTIRLLGVNGTPVKDSNNQLFLSKALAEAAALGADTELLNLRDYELHECKHCNFCVRRQKEGVYCSQKDEMSSVILPKVEQADILWIASPAYFGRLSGLTALFIDRLRAFVFGNHYGGCMHNKIGGALAVAWGRNTGLETTLLSIDYAFFALEMLVATVHHQSVFYGATGVTSKYGSGKFDPEQRHGVMEDEIGLKQIKALAQRSLELAAIVHNYRKEN